VGFGADGRSRSGDWLMVAMYCRLDVIFWGGGTVSFGVSVVWLAALGVGGNGWFGRKGSGGVLMRGGFGGVGMGRLLSPGITFGVVWGRSVVGFGGGMVERYERFGCRGG